VLIYYTSVLIYYTRVLIYYTSVLIYYTSVLIYYTSVLIYYTSVLIYYTSVLIYYTSVLIYYTSVLIYYASVLIYYTSVLIYYASVLIIYYTSVLIYYTSVLIYYTSVLIYYSRVLIYYSSVLIYYSSVLIYYASVLIYYTSVLIYYTSVLIYYISVLIYYTSVLIYYTRVLIYYTSVLIYYTSVLIYYTSVLIYYTRVLIYYTSVLIYYTFTTPETLAFEEDDHASHDPTVEQPIADNLTPAKSATFDLCKSRALREGRNFVKPNILTEESLAAACSSPGSAKAFKRSIEKIIGRNAWVDVRHAFHPEHHFNDETFLGGRDLITSGVSAVKASVKQQSYEAARQKLGEVLHTLQDFYSHSNWIELGNRRPFSSLIKPGSTIDNIAGKCSHGGFFDSTSRKEPKGGINKDTVESEHGFLHIKAVEVAIAATRELLEDIKAAVGGSEFLRLMGLTQASVLCFVIDTTGSMSDDIAEVRRVTSSIIDSKAGTARQNSEYILVPFNDPGFGPLTRTTDPDVFKSKINALTADGGGDRPEMCLSGLQVTFMLTNALSARRRRSSGGQQDDQQQFSSRLSNPLNDIYQNLAQASGGQAIEVTKALLPKATSIIVDTSSSSLVTVFQAVRNPAKAETFSFFVDSSLQNLTIYITGNSPYYNITSPSGVSQKSAETSGALGLIQTVGNFHTVRLHVSDLVGQWFISINSAQPYTVKVLDSNVTLLFSMLGGDRVRPTEIALVEASSSNTFNGTLKEVSLGMFLATIKSVPAGEFVVRVVGGSSFSKASNGFFQRQSSTQLHASNVTVIVQADGTLEPGKSFTLPFTVATKGSGGIFSIRVSNDRGFVMTTVPSSLTLERGGSANATVSLAVPKSTPSGSDITVTIEAQGPGEVNSNYAVLRLSVIAPVTDIYPPVCEVVSVKGNCSGNCSLSSWDISAYMTDRNGSGIHGVTIRQGSGTLNTSTVLDRGVNITVAFYSASCCFPEMELVMVDAVDLMMMTTRLLIKSSIGLFFMFFYIQSWTTAFMTDLSSSSSSQISMTHEGITRAAILQTTAEVCRSQAIKGGRDFVLPPILTEESLAEACFSPGSAKAFTSIIKKITQNNAWVDVRHVFSAEHHFDDQTFNEGQNLIKKGVSTVKANVMKQSYEAAREELGKVLHTLQDFYSHSNWIELGNVEPCSKLIQPSSQIDNIADSATCRSCAENSCMGNILEEIISQQKLTSGYFSLTSDSKPAGKCSHGGSWDQTSKSKPLGGINKDDEHSVHGYLHLKAAQVAVAATRELLEDIRVVAGDLEFLR
ncbi:hypothetical protein NFI96_022023, partial [Prochilodus magdalenae]